MIKNSAKLVVLLGFLLTSCATTPDPEKVCTAKWVSAKAERAMKEFKRDVNSSLKTVRRTSSAFDNGGTLGPIQALSLVAALNDIVTKFESSQALKDLRILSETCDDPEVLKRSFTKFLNDEGAPPEIIDMLDRLDGFQLMFEGADY